MKRLNEIKLTLKAQRKTMGDSAAERSIAYMRGNVLAMPTNTILIIDGTHLLHTPLETIYALCYKQRNNTVVVPSLALEELDNVCGKRVEDIQDVIDKRTHKSDQYKARKMKEVLMSECLRERITLVSDTTSAMWLQKPAERNAEFAQKHCTSPRDALEYLACALHFKSSGRQVTILTSNQRVAEVASCYLVPTVPLMDLLLQPTEVPWLTGVKRCRPIKEEDCSDFVPVNNSSGETPCIQ